MALNIKCDDRGTAFVEVTDRKESVEADVSESEKLRLAPDGYSTDELRRLWLSFCTDSDAAEKLAGFAGCTTGKAKELIKEFRSSSRTKRLEEADAQRKLANDTTTPEKPTGSPEKPIQAKRKGRQKKIVEAEIDDSQLEHIAPDALLAALVNNKYEFSEILAEGRNTKRSVIIERFAGVYRLKRTSFQFFGDFDSALQAARKEGLKLKTFGS